MADAKPKSVAKGILQCKDIPALLGMLKRLSIDNFEIAREVIGNDRSSCPAVEPTFTILAK